MWLIETVGLLYWNWHSIHNGYEAYWMGLLGHDLTENPPYREACAIGAEWKRLADRLVPLKKENKVAVVVDNISLDGLQWYPVDKDLTYNDIVRQVYDSLYELNIECDVVDVNALDPARYRLGGRTFDRKDLQKRGEDRAGGLGR